MASTPNAIDVVPDSTTHQAFMSRALAAKSSSDSLASFPSSPTSRYPKSSGATLADPMDRPQPRWAAARTYGRKKDASIDDQPQTDDMDLVLLPSPVHSPIASTPQPLQSSSQENEEANTSVVTAATNTVAMSDDEQSDDNNKEGNASSPSTSRFRYSWQKQLADIDQEYDAREEEVVVGRPSVLVAVSSMEDVTADIPSDVTNVPPRARDLFGTSSLSTMPSASSSQAPQEHSPKMKVRRSVTTLESATERDSDSDQDAPARASRQHRPLKKRMIASDSEEEAELMPPPRKSKPKALRSPAAASRYSNSSPTAEGLFDSPEKRASSPPTTPPDDETGSPRAASALDISGGMSKGTNKRSKTKEPRKIKPLNKKQQDETTKETARLFAERPVTIPEVQKEQPRFTVTHLFNQIAHQQPNKPLARAKPRRHIEHSSDPIITSSQALPSGTPVATRSALLSPPLELPIPASRPIAVPSSFKPNDKGKTPALFSNDVFSAPPAAAAEELPDLDDVFNEAAQNAATTKKYKALQEYKLRMAREQAEKKLAQVIPHDSDDECEFEMDLDVESQQESLQVTEMVAGQFKTGEKLRNAVLKDKVKAVTTPGRKNPNLGQAPKQFRHHPTSSSPVTDSQMAQIAMIDPFDLRRDTPPRPKGKPKRSSARLDNEAILANLQHKSLVQAADLRKQKDDDWQSRGGKSARARQLEATAAQAGAQKQKWLEKGLEAGAAGDEADVEEDEDEGEDAEWKEGDDEEEGDENAPPRSPSTVVEDEDKENEDVGDKENLPPSAGRQALSALHDDEADDNDDKENAAPLQSLGDDEDEEMVLRPVPRRSNAPRRIVDDDDEEAENDENLPPTDENAPPPRLAAANFDADSDDEENGPPRPTAALFGGLGGKMLFNSSQESLGLGDDADFDLGGANAEVEGDGFTQLFGMDAKPKNPFDALRAREPLNDMDLESQKLLPTMDLSTQDLQRDDAIFEQDQNARAVFEREERRKALAAKVYLNEDGFYTQTKPMESPFMSSRIFDSMSLTQTVIDSQAQSQKLDFDEDSLEVSGGPLRRLRRGRQEDSDDGEEDSEVLLRPSPPKKPKNAFDALKQGASVLHSKTKRAKMTDEEKKLVTAEFLQGEAQESDDEDVRGFGGPKEDEHEDEDDKDKVVEGLVDDAEMDEATMNAAAIREKAAEDFAKRDQELEAMHLAATKGEFRGKKRDRGVGMDDSDSDDDDDDDARRRRQAISRKRQVVGDTLDELGNNPRTKAFLEHYQQALEDDDEDDVGAHLASDAPVGIPMDQDGNEDEYESDGQDENEEDEEAVQETITPDQLRRELQDAIRNPALAPPIDVNDVSWTDVSAFNDVDEEEEDEGVMEVDQARAPSYRTLGRTEVDPETRKEDLRLKRLGGAKSKFAPRREEKGMTGFGGGKARSAITGHASKSSVASSASAKRRAPTKSGSMLQGIGGKKTRFE